MKISVKTSFLLFGLFFSLSAKHGYTMDLPGWRQAENGGVTKRAICTHSPYPYVNFHDLNFHDLRRYSQTNQLNNKSVMEYFNDNRVVVDYFKVLHQIMAISPHPDQKKLWDLAKIAAVYDAKVQSWILSYAINYIRDHNFLAPSRKEISPRFHQWAYIVRSFQGYDVKFEADSFIDSELDKNVLSCDLRASNLGEKMALKVDGFDFSTNPKEALQRLQKIKPLIFKKEFTEDQKYFGHLFLYDSPQDIQDKAWSIFINLKSPSNANDVRRLKLCVDLLFMRRTKKSLNAIIQGFLDNQMQAGKFWWIEGTRIFFETYNSWKFATLLEDEDMKRGLEKLSNLMSKKGVLLIPPWEPNDKAKNRKRNRTASLT